MNKTPGQLAYEEYCKHRKDERLSAWDGLGVDMRAMWESVAMAAVGYWVGKSCGIRDNGERRVVAMAAVGYGEQRVGTVESFDLLSVNVVVY